MRSIVTIGFSHCFIGPIRGPMLLRCWRNVIRPRPTVNIHISGPQRNMRRGCFTHLGWTDPFHLHRPENKSGHSWMRMERNRVFFISQPRRWRNRKPLKREGEEERDGSEPISPFLFLPDRCSHGSQTLCAALLRCIIWIHSDIALFLIETFLSSYLSTFDRENAIITYKGCMQKCNR